MPQPARRLALILLVLASLGLAILLLVRALQPNHNRLALGAKTTVDTIDVALSPPQELDGMTRAAILELRRQAAARDPGLLAGSYAPSPPGLSDQRWLALVGHCRAVLPWQGGAQYRRGVRRVALYPQPLPAGRRRAARPEHLVGRRAS